MYCTLYELIYNIAQNDMTFNMIEHINKASSAEFRKVAYLISSCLYSILIDVISQTRNTIFSNLLITNITLMMRSNHITFNLIKMRFMTLLYKFLGTIMDHALN